MTNVAVFGAGRIGRIHASNIAALPGVTLKYISDPVPTYAAELAGQLGAEVASIEAALADKSVDVVAICSSTDTHSDLITRAAAAGKHILLVGFSRKACEAFATRCNSTIVVGCSGE